MSWIRKKRKYTKPRKPFDKIRIEEENELVEKYGLKNKKEIWKAESAIERIRKQAKKLITADQKEQAKLTERLRKIGFKVETIADILSLNKEDWLKRRLQSILIQKALAKPKQARQLITHKHVSISGKIINIPSAIIGIEEENSIQILKNNKVKKTEILENG